MTTPKLDVSDQAEKAKQLAQAGRTITEISEEMGITWGEARNLVPNSSWRGAKVRITNRLNTLAKETNPRKREQLAAEADKYVDFLYDAAKHLRGQVDGVRKALDR